MTNKLTRSIISSSVISMAILGSFCAHSTKKEKTGNISLNQNVELFGLKAVDVPGDGKCFYHAISHQLRNKGYTHINGRSIDAKYIESITSQHIEKNRELYGNYDHAERDAQGDQLTAAAIAKELGMQVIVVKDRPPTGENLPIFTPIDHTDTLIIGRNGVGDDGHYWSLIGDPNQTLQDKIRGRHLLQEGYLYALDGKAEMAKIPALQGSLNQNATSIAGFTKQTLALRSSNLSIVAAGEDKEKLNGAWIQGIGGISTDTNTPGIKAKTNFAGFALGYERLITDDTLIGASISFTNGTIKYGSSEKATNKTYVGSLYGIHNIDNILINGALFFGKGAMKATRQLSDQTLVGKPNITVYGAIAEIGYKFEHMEHSLIPSISAQYAAINQSQYKETGGNAAQSYGKRTGQIFEGDIAAKYQYALQTNQFLLLPSIKVGVARNIQLKSSDLKYKLANGNDAIYPIKGNRNQQTKVFASPELMMKSDSFDFSLSYKFEKAKKYTGHMFGAKLMAKF